MIISFDEFVKQSGGTPDQVKGTSKPIQTKESAVSQIGDTRSDGAFDPNSNIKESAKGFVKGALDTVASSGQFVNETLNKGANALGIVTPQGQEAQIAQAQSAQALDTALEPSNPQQKAGKTLETIAEFVAPTRTAQKAVINTAKGALEVGQALSKVPGKAVSGVEKGVKKGVEKVANSFDVLPVDAPDNIKTSLNPFLTNTKADISVPTENGYVLKKISQITPDEKIAVQKETSNLYNNMLKKAKQFKEDRRDTFSPLEVVGKRTDKALEDVNNLRKIAGKTMSDIESQYQKQLVDVKGTRLENFVNEYLGGSNKFGRKMKDTTLVDNFASDYDKLAQNPNVKDVLDFTRSWTKELEDLKDGFGAFKENKRTYTLIEGALSDIKNGARNLISKDSPEYSDALSKYRLTSQIREESNRLLGKEGLLGDTLKGGAAAKRAVQSASDQGARQFYNVLKKVTGYDGLKEADIALQAMKDVGDYQGLSLLEINKDLYQATIGKIISKVPFGESAMEITKAVANKVVPQEERVRKLIKK